MKKIRFYDCFFQILLKIYRVMRLALLLIFVSSTIAFGTGSYSQSTKLTLHLENVTVKEALNSIEERSEFIFFYQDRHIDLDRKVNLSFYEENIESILNQLFYGTKNTYIIRDRQIIIYEKKIHENPVPDKIEKSQPEKQVTGTGSIRGNITDERGFPMIGATIIVDKTTVGTIADANGNYQLLGVPAGRQVIKFSFVGYNTESREIELERGDVIVLNVKMSMSQVELLEVVAYGQARGQQAAINQQLRAPGIVNVISAEKLQELPDVNVAEAIGRLPGLMVERNRGEGQKIIIRGLEPKYNSISIGGNVVPSTSTDDRSTDLNMISPDILGGVEVQKANTADMDASGLGGTVNLTLREAPANLKLNATVLTGYSGFSNSLSNYRANFYLSNRFFNNKLGVMLTGNAETAERNSDAVLVNYDVQGIPNYNAGETYIKPWILNLNLQSNIEDRSRAGGSLLFDWKISPKSTIKSSNFIGYLHQHMYDRSKTYYLSSNYIYLSQYDNIVKQLLVSNSIEGKHFILSSVLDWGGSRSISINDKPYGHIISFAQDGAFNGYTKGKSFDIEPPELLPSPENINENLDAFFLGSGSFRTYKAEEEELSAFMNWQTPFSLGQKITGYVKAGTKYRLKDRFRLNTRYNHPMEVWKYVDDFLQVYPDYTVTPMGTGKPGLLSLTNFLDKSYEERDFMNNKYEYFRINEVPDRKLLATLYDDYFKDYYFFIASGAKDDYETYESIFSYYLMSEINLGKYLTFIPGVRYEKTHLEYKAYIANEINLDERGEYDAEFSDTTGYNTYPYFFPQIHLRIKPLDWFDIRLAYTKTISRPDYDQLAPKKIINIPAATVTLGNTRLNPALSTNYDIICTFYKQKYGLLTFGIFYKEIEGFLWTRRASIVSGTATDPELFNLNRETLGYIVTYPLNNPNMSSIKGFELDIQSNMNFLPVKGFVFNFNFTLMNSETKYSETLMVRALNPDYGKIPGVPRVIFVNQDTAYVDRLLKQPSYLANIGLGYDNKKIGLSVRLSYNFQDDILVKEQRRPDGADREATLEFYRWDFQVNQRITKKLVLNANVANIFNQPDRSIRLITGYMRNIEYYGYLAQIGIKYDFF